MNFTCDLGEGEVNFQYLNPSQFNFDYKYVEVPLSELEFWADFLECNMFYYTRLLDVVYLLHGDNTISIKMKSSEFNNLLEFIEEKINWKKEGF